MKGEQLGDFLRTRRERIDPVTIGFPIGSNRRTPGLRREEVAVLAGVGASWLTRLEQGNAKSVSAEVLHGLATALRLSATERSHLFSLADVHLVTDTEGSIFTETHRRLVDGLNPNPAYLLDHHWNIAAWNQSEEELFPILGDPSIGDHPNLLRLFLGQQSLRTYIDDWSLEIERLTRQFRSHVSAFPSAALDELASELRAEYLEFAEAWARHDVAPLRAHVRVINHPQGQQRFEQHRLAIPDSPGWQLVLFPASLGARTALLVS